MAEAPKLDEARLKNEIAEMLSEKLSLEQNEKIQSLERQVEQLHSFYREHPNLSPIPAGSGNEELRIPSSLLHLSRDSQHQTMSMPINTVSLPSVQAKIKSTEQILH